jgi:hypothetical protein
MTMNQKQSILVETVKQFGRQQWFRDATVYDKHPDSAEPTMEFKVNYIPILERKNVKEFCLRWGLSDRYIIVDQNGKQVQ